MPRHRRIALSHAATQIQNFLFSCYLLVFTSYLPFPVVSVPFLYQLSFIFACFIIMQWFFALMSRFLLRFIHSYDSSFNRTGVGRAEKEDRTTDSGVLVCQYILKSFPTYWGIPGNMFPMETFSYVTTGKDHEEDTVENPTTTYINENEHTRFLPRTHKRPTDVHCFSVTERTLSS